MIIWIFLLIYSVKDTTIQKRQIDIRAFDQQAGISNHNTWIIIMLYSKTVVIFPYHFAPYTTFVFRIASKLKMPVNTSFAISTKNGIAIRGNLESKQPSIAICVSLSAIGSRAFPRSLIMQNLLAIIPSTISVKPDRARIAAVNLYRDSSISESVCHREK